MESPSPAVTRVALQNYKSIAHANVVLGSLTILVGPNGSGKSNFVDALRFVSDSLTTTLDHAMRDRGGINDVRRRSGGHPTHFGVRLDFKLPEGGTGFYAFRVAARKGAGYEVQREECVTQSEFMSERLAFVVEAGRVKSSSVPGPAAAPDRLYLVAASGLPEFRPVYDLLSRMGFYNLNPDVIRDLQAADAGDVLKRDGANLASVLGRIAEEDAATKSRIEEYLGAIVPGVTGVDRKVVGPRETIEFRQRVSGSAHPWKFGAMNMSDGTLRATGVLVALFQLGAPLVAIEEPETALHPAAAGVLYDALVEASGERQVLITSHSPDLLDNPAIATEAILAVEAKENATQIAPIGSADRSVLARRLYTIGELLRLGQLSADSSPATPDQPNLFSQ